MQHLDASVARPGGLEADRVVRRALATSPELRAQAAACAAAAAAVDQALVAFLPRLTLAGRLARLSPIVAPVVGTLVGTRLPDGTPANTPVPLAEGAPLVGQAVAFPVILNQTSLQASLAVPLLDYALRLPALKAAASRTAAAAALTLRAARVQVGHDARLLYYAWARARLQAVVAEQTLAQASEHLARVERAFKVGTVSRADVLRTQAQRASSDLFVARAHDYEHVVADALKTAMHVDADAELEIGEDLRVVLPPVPAAAVSPLAPLVAEAQATRLELQAVGASVAVAAAQLSVARAGYLPRLDAVGEVVLARPNPRFIPQQDRFDATWAAGVQLSWAPNDVANAAFAATGATAKGAQVEAQQAALKDSLRAEVIRAVEAIREADLAVRAATQGLDAAEESYRVRSDLFAVGSTTNVELTDSETELTQARLSAVGARIDQRTARAQLAHALGRDVAWAEAPAPQEAIHAPN